MNTLHRAPLIAAMLAAVVATVVPASMPASASTTLQRCRTPDGSIGYTDRSCAIFGAGSMLESSEVIADMDMRDSWPRAGTGRRSPASGCARSSAQLATDLYGAFALGDVNRVAESYHFAGMSSSAGRVTMNRLERLLKHEVLDSQSFGTGGLQVLLADANGSASAINFDVHRYAGCYFVSF